MLVWILVAVFCGLPDLAEGVQQVYVSNGTHVLSYSRERGAQGNDAVIAVLGKSGYRIVGLAADLGQKYLFWSDISTENKGIYRSDLNGGNATCIIKDVGEVDGLTVDWISKHIYWTDNIKLTIEIANYDGSGRRILISTGLKTPKSIVAAPIFGFLFWVDQRGKRIERSWLDGTHRRTIIKSSEHWPNQMDISHQHERLYWVDAKSLAVFSCDLGGKAVKKEVKYKKITKGAPGFGLIVYGNTAIVSTWLNTGIYSILLGSRRTIWQQETKNLGTRELFHMISLNPSTQPMKWLKERKQENGKGKKVFSKPKVPSTTGIGETGSQGATCGFIYNSPENQDESQVRNIENRGRGVVAIKPFKKDDFFVEYAGDLIDVKEAKQRDEEYSKDPPKASYMFYFNFKNKNYCIDATAESGKLGRLLNHSKTLGNCHPKTVGIEDQPCVILVASRDISVGEELLYDYAIHPCMEDDKGGCSHLCLPGQKSKYRCTCPTYGGLALAADGKTCQVPKHILLSTFSNHGKSSFYKNGDIGFVSLDTNWSREVTLISESGEPGAVAYDPLEQMVYWSDSYGFDSSIYRVRLDGTEKSMLLNKSHGLGQVDGLAFDSETGLLYFTNFGLYSNGQDDSNYSWHRVEVVNVHTNDRKTILQDVAIAIVLDKKQQYLYTIDTGPSARIIQSDLDGHNMITLNIVVNDPVGLVIVNDNIVVYDRDGSNMTVLTYDRSTRETRMDSIEDKNIGSVTVYGEQIFYTEIENGYAKNIVQDNGTDSYTVLKNVYPNSVLYTPSTANIVHDHQTACINYGCSHTCIPLPKDQDEPYRCICPGEAFLVLGEDGKTCKRPEKFVLYADATTISFVSLDKVKVTTPVVTPVVTPVTLIHSAWGDMIDTVIYDQTKDRIYWTAVKGNTIYVSRIEHLRPAIVYQEEGQITSLRLDAGKQKLYWTANTDTDEGFIATLNLKRGLRSYKRIKKGNRNKMWGLALNPDGKHLYWIESGSDMYSPQVKMSNSKGRREFHVRTLSLFPATTMVVTEEKIFIGSSAGNVFEMNLQGEITEFFDYTAPDISSIDVLDHLILYTSLKQSTLTAVDMTTGAEVTVATNLTRPTSLFVQHPGDLIDECKMSYPCEEICSPLLWGQYQCSCNTGKVLSPDQHTCMIDLGTTRKATTTTTTISMTTTVMATTDASVKVKDVNEGQGQNETKKNEVKVNDLEDDLENDLKDDLDDIFYVNTEKTTRHRDYAEPKPTTSTKQQDIRTEVMTSTEKTMNIFDEMGLRVGLELPVKDKPRISHCPVGEVITTKLTDTTDTAEIPVDMAAYDSDGFSLPLHCNYELTPTGLLVPWKGGDNRNQLEEEKGNQQEGEKGSRHEVVCKATDMDRQTTTCIFTVIVKDVSPPVFTFCPSDLKIKQTNEDPSSTWLVPEAVDNVGVVKLAGSHGPGHSFSPGVTKVNYTVLDGAGNAAYCTFNVFILEDQICNLPDIRNGGIICNNQNGVEDCSIVCETGFVVNPIRTFRRHFDCKHPDDIEALKKTLGSQLPCLESKYPSIIQQEFSLLFHGPINKHRSDVMSRLTVAVTNQLVREELCTDQICEVGNLTVPCARDVLTDNQSACIEDEELNLFSVTFNVTVRNDTKSEDLDMLKLLQDIHKELMNLAALFKLELEEHKYQAIQDSLASARVKWLCPLGQISEGDICIACPPGTFHNITVNVCQYCGPSFYQDSQGQVTCKPCGPGHTAPDGATMKSLCHSIPSMDEMTLFIIVTACSFGVVFLCMAITLYLQFQRQQKRHQQAASQKKTRYNMTPNIYVAPPPILKSKLDENLSPGQRSYSIDKKHPINIYNNHDYEEMDHNMSVYENGLYSTTPTSGRKILRDYSPVEEIPTGTLSRENTFSTSSYSPQFGVKRSAARSVNTPSPGQQRKMSHDSTFSNQSPKMMRVQRTPTSDTPLITQSPLLRLKLAAYNLNHED